MSNETIITIVGNLTADPDLQHTQSGLAVVNLTIASTPRIFDKQANEWKDGDALFLRASAWREFAENIAGSLSKGSRVIASGKLVQKNFETKEGEKRSGLELELQSIGPDLLYATAAVTRAGSATASRNNEARRDQRPAEQRQDAVEQPRGYAPGEATAEATAAAQPAEPWLTSTYEDETPF